MSSSSSDPAGSTTHPASKGKSKEAQRFLQDLLWDYLFELFEAKLEAPSVKLKRASEHLSLWH